MEKLIGTCDIMGCSPEDVIIELTDNNPKELASKNCKYVIRLAFSEEGPSYPFDVKTTTESIDQINYVEIHITGSWEYEALEKTVKESGNSGRVYTPKEWIGKRVKLVLLEPLE